MKRVLHTTLALLLIAVLFVGMVPTAQAETAENVMTVEIPVTINTSGSIPVDGAYAKFEIIPLEGAPTPILISPLNFLLSPNEDGVTSEKLKFNISGMGVYKYKIKMVGGTYFHPEDAVEYYADCYNYAPGYTDHVEIYDGQYGNGHKFANLAYNWPLMDVNVAKKWVDQESVRPGSIEVELLLNGERPTVLINDGAVTAGYENLVMNKSYNWQRKWEGVDARCATYSVKEVKVPAGYVATYKYADGVYTITNTGALIQTGQLNWPIPVLCGAGCLFLLAGLLMLRRKEEENA